MNNIHNNGENDKSLSEGLDKLGHAYEQLEQNEPPELLDQAILNSAHRAVKTKPHWMQFGWLHGLTTAAVFVLALSIILDQRETAPVYEDALRSSETTGLTRQKAAKKQPVGESKFESFQLPGKEIGERRQDMQQNMPAAAAPAMAEMESAPTEMAEQPVLKLQRTRYVSDDAAGKTDSDDKDAPARELMLEEALMDELDLMTATPQAGAISKQIRPVVAAEPAASEAKSRARTESEAEQRLLAIIKLKQDGDDSWATELESFKEDYPDYPLPDEFTD